MESSRLAGLVGDLRATRAPAYRALADRVRVLVADGRLPAGTRLPAERSLATALGASRVTVTRAYRERREDGWADARHGAGTWTRLPASDGSHTDGAWVPRPERAGVIDLAHAAPPAPEALAGLVRRAVERLGPELGGHGYGPDGLPALRERVAARFTARGVPTDPDRIVVTGGALHAIGTAVAVTAGAGERVLAGHPTYPGALDVLDDAGVRVVPVDTGRDSPQVALPRAARQTAARAAYLMADFSNPTGELLDDDARARLLARLARQDVVTVVDETFAELDLRTGGGSAPLPCAAHAPREDDVITVGGLSKIAWGGLRLGWARAGRETAARMRRRLARAQIAPPVLEQMIGVEVLDALDELRAGRAATLRRQRDTLARSLAATFPGWRWAVPDGGLVLWCDLGAPLSSALAAAAPRHGLTLAPGPRFGSGHAFDDRLRIPFTHPEPVLAEAVTRLRRTLDDVTGPHAPTGTPPPIRSDVVV